MSPFRKFFDACSRSFGSRDAAASGRRGSSGRRRRQRPQAARLGGCEQLEPKQVMAANLFEAIADQTLTTSAPVTIDLANHFDESTVTGTVVKFATNAPIGVSLGSRPALSNADFFVELFDEPVDQPVAGRIRTPLTASNFLSYVNDGLYVNTLVHRSVGEFVIQGGGYTAPTVPANVGGSDPGLVPQRPAVQNEPGNSNVRGTIAMAKLGGQPDSATNQFYFNLQNNTNLNTDNGGYTVFGKVLGSGMTVVDVMATALTYNATTYYGNGAYTDFPLWNVNADNIIQPNDFVKFTDVSVVPETALLNFQVTVSEGVAPSSKLVVDQALLANGQLKLTPAANATGTVTVRVSATSALGGAAVSETFDVRLGQPSPVLTAIESNGQITLGKDADGTLYADRTQMLLNGKTINFDHYKAAGMEAIAAEVSINGNANALLWKLANGSIYHWAFDASWNRIAAFGLYAPGSSGFAKASRDFGVDLGNVQLEALEQTGNVTLNIDPQGNLYADQQPLILNGSLINSTAYAAAGMTAVAVESNVDGHNALAWRLNDGSVYQWRFNEGWIRTEAYGRHAASTAGFFAAEEAFAFDINQDGTIGRGTELTPLEENGQVFLSVDEGGNLYAGATPLTLNGNTIDYNAFAARGMTAVAVETTATSGNVLAWRLTDGSAYKWKFDAGWNRTEVLGRDAVGTEKFYETEKSFDSDFDNDGFVGAVTTVEQAGNTALRINAQGILYANSTPLKFNGGTISYEIYSNAGMTAVAVEANLDGSNTLVWRLADGAIYQWRFDTTWNRLDAFGRHNAETAGFFSIEQSFETDINQDGFIGSVAIIEQAGSIPLRTDSRGALYAGRTQIKFNGTMVDFNLYLAGGMTAVAAERIESHGNVLVWRLADGAIYNWKFDENWNRTDVFGRFLVGSDDFYETERLFGVDLDGDRFAGRNEVIEQAGVNRLQRDIDGNLHVDGVPVTFNGNPVNYNVFNAAGMTAIAADIHPENGNALLWRLANGSIYHWSFDASWARTGAFGMYSPADFEASNAAIIFGVSLSGVSLTPIETNGAFSLQTDGSGYLRANGSILRLNNNPISFDAFANGGMTAIAFESTSEGNILLWRLNSGYAYQWEFNDEFARTRGFGLYAPGTAEFRQLESVFEVTMSA